MRWSNFTCCFAEVAYIALQSLGGREYADPVKNTFKGRITLIYVEKILIVCNTVQALFSIMQVQFTLQEYTTCINNQTSKCLQAYHKGELFMLI